MPDRQKQRAMYRMLNDLKKFITKAVLPAMMIISAGLLSSCHMPYMTTDNTTENTSDDPVENWIDSVTDERGVYIGQEKEVVGKYKRIGIVKIGGTYEDMLKLRDIEKQGYLVAADDGTAYFELDGAKTEYVFDGGNFYLRDDTERANGFSYTCINGRLIINDGVTITQYMKVTDEEAEY